MTGPSGPAAPYGSYGSQRLSPRILLIDPLRTLGAMAVPLVGILIFGGLSSQWFAFAWFGAVGAAGVVVLSAVRWATFSYRVTADRLELSRQLFSRSVRTIPLDRIRGVDITASPLQRLLGLAAVRVESAATGEQSEEGVLDGVAVAEAERLRALLLSRTPTTRPTAASAGEAGADVRPVVVYGRAPRRWAWYGPLSGAFLFTPFALLAGAVGVAFDVYGGVRPQQAEGIARWLLDRPAMLAVFAVILLIATPIIAAGAYAVFNWDFTLRERDGSLVAERGLLTRRSVSLERRRIRGYEVVDGPLERLAKAARLRAVVTGLGEAAVRGQLLPAAPREFVWTVAAAAIGPFTTPLSRHPRAALTRRVYRAVTPWLGAGVVLWIAGLRGLATGCAVLAVLGLPLGVDRYRSLGHGIDGDRFSLRSGSLRRGHVVLERRALVGWRIRQTMFQRRAGLVTVIAAVGAGAGGYPAIDVAEPTGAAFAHAITEPWLAPFLVPDG